MAQAGTLEVVITATTSGLTAGIANARGAINKFAPDIKRYATILTGSLVAGLTASVYAFGQAQVSATNLARALGNQGITARKALEDLLAYSTELQHLSGVSDETIQGIMAQMTSFGATGEELKRLTRATLDAAASDKDLEGASLALGKAFLGDTSRLKQYGITIDESIPKALRYAEALRQWEKLYGGAAAAKGKTFFGMIGIAKGDMSDFAEEIGRQLVPTVQRFVKFLIDNRSVLLKAAGQIGAAIRGWIDDFAVVVSWLRLNKGIIKASLEPLWNVVKLGPVLGTLKNLDSLLPGREGQKERQQAFATGFQIPGTIISTEPSPLIPAGIGAGGAGGGGDGGEGAETFARAWEDAMAKLSANAQAAFGMIKTFVDGLTSVLSTSFQEVFVAIAEGGKNTGEIFQKLGLSIRNLMFKVLADILAQMITHNIMIMVMTAARNKAAITGAAAVAAANNIAASAAIPFGWIVGVAMIGVIMAAVMALASGLAEGGIVNRPTLALIGEAGPEAVVPLSRGKDQGLLGGGGGPSITIQINGEFLEADEGKWDNLVRRHIVPALAAYQDKTRESDIRKWPSRSIA